MLKWVSRLILAMVRLQNWIHRINLKINLVWPYWQLLHQFYHLLHLAYLMLQFVEFNYSVNTSRPQSKPTEIFLASMLWLRIWFLFSLPTPPISPLVFFYFCFSFLTLRRYFRMQACRWFLSHDKQVSLNLLSSTRLAWMVLNNNLW